MKKMIPNYLHAAFAEIHEKINEIIDHVETLEKPKVETKAAPKPAPKTPRRKK